LNHHPLIIGLKERGDRRSKRSREEKVWRGVWDEEGGKGLK